MASTALSMRAHEVIHAQAPGCVEYLAAETSSAAGRAEDRLTRLRAVELRGGPLQARGQPDPEAGVHVVTNPV